MKKSVICILSLACLLLVSCNTANPIETDTVPAAQTTTASGGASSDSPKTMRWGFYSYEDFLLFATTESRDVSLYQKPPQGDVFPPFKIQEKSLLDYEKMFPFLTEDDVKITYVEIINDHLHGISVRSKASEAYIAITIEYHEDRMDSSVDSIIADTDRAVVRGDYYSLSLENAERRKSIRYVFPCQSCTLSYVTFDNQVSGLVIDFGKYSIRIGAQIISEPAFFTDEALSSLSCLFQSGEERDKAVLRIQNYLDSVK